MESSIVVVIPCLNEEKTVAKVISDWKKALPSAEIIVYDNVSCDKTVEKAKEAKAEVKTCSVRGKGNVLRQVFRDENADCLIIVDGDDTYGTECAEEMVSDIIHGGCGMSVGTRARAFDSELSISHDFGNRLVRSMVNHLCKTDYSDIMSGCRAFSKRFYKSFPASCGGFETETEMNIYAGMTGMKVAERPLSYRNRKKGSKVRTISDGAKIIFMILKERFRWKRYRKKKK